VTPTRLPTLLLTVVVSGVLAYLLADAAYSDLPRLPVLAAFSLVLLAVTELAMARVVRDRVGHRRRRDGAAGRPLHPLQVARAVVLAKASSPTGALLAGAYGGLAAWALPRRDQSPTIADDATAAVLSAAAALLLVVAALLLERACRTPDVPGDVEESAA
jgi:hypothetical protein